MSEEKKEVIDNVLGARSRSRQNSTATVVTGDIVTEESVEEVKEEKKK